MPLCGWRTGDFENGRALVHLVKHGHIHGVRAQPGQCDELLPKEPATPTRNQTRSRRQPLQVIPTKARIDDWDPEHPEAFALVLIFGPVVGSRVLPSGCVGHIVANIPGAVSAEPPVKLPPGGVGIMTPVPVAATDQEGGVPAWGSEEVNQAVS